MTISEKIMSERCYVFSHKHRQSIALNDVIYRAGSVSALSKFFGIPHQASYQWKKQGWVPESYSIRSCITLFRSYGCRASRSIFKEERMDSVVKISPQLRKFDVPAELRMILAWLLWRFKQFGNESEARKIPYWVDGTPRHRQQGSTFDRDRLTGRSRWTIFADLNCPKPVTIGPRVVAWVSEEIGEWIEARIQERGHPNAR